MVGHAIWPLQCPKHFMRLMNQVFKPFLNKFVVVYFNNMLIYIKIEKEHFEHLKRVEVLEQQKLYGNFKKCTSFALKVVFLCYIVSAKGIQVDPSKVEAIRLSNLGQRLLLCMIFGVSTG